MFQLWSLFTLKLKLGFGLVVCSIVLIADSEFCVVLVFVLVQVSDSIWVLNALLFFCSKHINGFRIWFKFWVSAL